MSLDVKQMQPTFLAKVSLDHGAGEIPFFSAIFRGEDVYVLLQVLRLTVERRLCMDDIGTMFKGDVKWVRLLSRLFFSLTQLHKFTLGWSIRVVVKTRNQHQSQWLSLSEIKTSFGGCTEECVCS